MRVCYNMNNEITQIILSATSQRSAVCKIAYMMRQHNPSLSQSFCMKSAWTIVKLRKPSKLVVTKSHIVTPSSDLVIARRKVAEMKAQAEINHNQRLMTAEEHFASIKPQPESRWAA